MNLPKKLEKMREDLSLHLTNRDLLDVMDYTPHKAFTDGFNAVCELLLPEIEKMREVLIKYNTILEANKSDREMLSLLSSGAEACSVLRQWQEFAEGE